MSGPTSGKRLAGQLRYAHFKDWGSPVSYYYVEKITNDVWTIYRPLCHPDEEDAPAEHQVQVGESQEVGVFERVNVSTGKESDLERKPQPGVMGPDPILFHHLEQGLESPYTKQNLLAACPAGLRAGVTTIAMTPNGGHGTVAGDGPQGSQRDSAASASDGGDSSIEHTKGDPQLARLITLMELSLKQQQSAMGVPQPTMAQRPARDSGTFGSSTDGAGHAEAEAARWASRRLEVPGLVKLPPANANPHDHEEEQPTAASFDVLNNAVAALTHVVTKQQQQQQNTANLPSKLFKLEGAQGQVALDELAEMFAEQPRMAVDEFEAELRRQAGLPQKAALSNDTILNTWRNTAPLKDYNLACTVAEVIMDAYLAGRHGAHDQCLGRLALLLGALEQYGRDGHFKRAQYITGLPKPPTQLYKAVPPEEKAARKHEIGSLALLVGARRKTTATAAYKESRPGRD